MKLDGASVGAQGESMDHKARLGMAGALVGSTVEPSRAEATPPSSNIDSGEEDSGEATTPPGRAQSRVQPAFGDPSPAMSEVGAMIRRTTSSLASESPKPSEGARPLSSDGEGDDDDEIKSR